jgi:hypothetical protein
VFGGGTWPRFVPAARRSISLVHPLPCFGCAWDCPFGDAPCLKAITVPDVTAALLEILRDSNVQTPIRTFATFPPAALELIAHAAAARPTVQLGSGAAGALVSQVHEKQEEIERLARACREKDQEIVNLSAVAAERLSEMLEKETEIQNLARICAEREALLGSVKLPLQRNHLVIISPQSVLPSKWWDARAPLHLFNPSILADADGHILAYRLVGSDGRRRIGLCRLDRQLGGIPNSGVPFSDLMTFRPGESCDRTTSWFADPRLHRLGSSLYLSWNSGWHEPENSQFFQQLDQKSLLPIGRARPLHLRGKRQPLEKNWTFFDAAGPWGVYSVDPHCILQISLEGEGPLLCEPLAPVPLEASAYVDRYGPLRGGAPPQRRGSHYYSFCHSVYGPPGRYRYVPAVYRFSAEPPFAPTDRPVRPLPLPNPFGTHPLMERLNPVVEECLYPCGAVLEGDHWLISYGINDEVGAIAVLSCADVDATLTPVHT